MNMFRALTLACAAVVIMSTAAAANETERYLVEFADQRSEQGLAALLNAGGTVRRQLTHLNAVAVELPTQALAGLESNPNFLRIAVDPKRYPLSLDNLELEPWGIAAVQADQLADTGGVKVCIIDSGYSPAHPDLPAGSQVTGAVDDGAGPWDEDGCGHGTHVAGTIAAIGGNGKGVVGVLPVGTVDLHIVRVFNNSCTWSYASDLIGALEDCEQAGASVVSMSLGGTWSEPLENTAFSAANGRGVLSIAAAGNSGNSTNSYPASYSSVMSVAAVDEALNRASFSQYNAQVEISAPGVNVLSTVPPGTGTAGNQTASVNGVSYLAGEMQGSPTGLASGTLVDCGLGTSTCPGSEGAICLIQRGTISFADKTAACEAGGGDGAIIYNNVAGSINGTLNGYNSSIPVVTVTDLEGAEMLAGVGSAATVSVTSAASDYDAWNGTSMATPHVSGVASLVWGHFPDCTNDELRAALTATAADLGAAGRDNQFGYGLVQARDAYEYLQTLPCAGEPAPPAQTANPDPANGATQIDVNANLGWNSAAGAASYDVYFGVSNPPAFQVNQQGTSHEPGPLTAGQLYYWRVDSKNSAGTTPGPLWSFTTGTGTPQTVFLSGLAGAPEPAARGRWNAVVTATAGTSAGTGLDGIAIAGSWSSAPGTVETCTTTDQSGSCTFTARNIKGNVASVAFTVSAMSKPGYTYDASSNTPASTVTVFQDGGPPAAQISSFTASPNPIGESESTTLSWSVSNATFCEASGAWGGSKSAAGGSEIVTPEAAGDYTYNLSCTGDGGSDSGSVTVTVTSATAVAITSFTASPNPIGESEPTTLTWSVSNATSCVAGGAWGGSKSATGGSESVTPGGAGDYTYNLSCTGDGGSDSGSVTVTVNPPAPIVVNGSGSKDKGTVTVLLTWSGASGDFVDIYREGAVIATAVSSGTNGAGSYADITKGGSPINYQVCNAGTNVCGSTSVTF